VLVHDFTSGAVREVAPSGTAPSWSADGTRVAFVRDGRLLTRLTDGSAERALPIDGTGVRDVAWSPDGKLLALWVGDHIDLASADGAKRERVGEQAVGGAAWAPDADEFVYSRNAPAVDATVLYGISAVSDGEGLLWSARGPLGTDLEPEYAPSGSELVYTDRNTGTAPNPSLAVLTPGGSTYGGIPNTVNPSEPDWQPCTAGVTLSCTSITPPYVKPLPSCPASYSITTVAGRRTAVLPGCTANLFLRYEVVSPPAHGTATSASFHGIAYEASATFSGEDSFTYRAVDLAGDASAVARVVVTVTPKPPRPPKPAAPSFAVQGTPRLDRRGRTLLRGTCDRACTVKLRLRLKLHTGRTVDGRAVTASAVAGGRIAIRLTRAKLPARRRVVAARVIGTLTGTDGRTRSFSATVRRG
jgi:Tol biopolymer transport system component